MIAARILNRLAERLASELAPPSVVMRPWIVEDAVVGWLDDRRAAIAAEYDDVLAVDASGVRLRNRFADAGARSIAMDGVARDLHRRGELTRWRDERYPVDAPSGERLMVIERAAARFFGIRTTAAHVNGVTMRDGATAMWIARRSWSKPIEPGLLDNLVGGGVSVDIGVAATVVKEAYEEAGIPATIAQRARACGRVTIRRIQRDGLHHDTIHVHDLDLPPSFVPENQDGEAIEFRLVAPPEVAELAANADGADVMTADASLVVADWLIRTGEAGIDSPAGAKLAALRRAS